MFGNSSNTTGVLTNAFSVSDHPSKTEKAMGLVMRVFLYGIVFLGGYIFAKIQTLVAGL